MAQKTAFLMIDLQNDYLPEGKFPLANAKTVVSMIAELATRIQDLYWMPILVQHVAPPQAPFFSEGTPGARIVEEITNAYPTAPIVQKKFADSFWDTDLLKILSENGIQRVVLCGMMTQNCVTHTALSKLAEPFDIKIVGELCTTVSEILHAIALNALVTRNIVVEAKSLLG